MRANACDDISGENPAITQKTSKNPRLRFYGENFVLDTVSGSFYRLTPTAAFILQALIERSDRGDLAERVQNRFGTSQARAVRDVELFLSELRSLGLIEHPEP